MSYATQPHLCIWTRQRKRMGPIYWSLIFFFLHSVEFFENLLIHIRKEICLHFNEMMCKKLNWIVIIGWKPMCSMLNWFNDFLKTYTGQLPTVFHIEKVISFLSQKNYILSLLKRILFLTEKLLFQKHTKF